MSDPDSTPDDLYMIQCWLDSRGLTKLTKMLHLPLDDVDDHYMVHCALGELFQDDAPKPYCLEGGGDREIRVLGYSSKPGDALQQIAQGFAQPTIYEICDWDRWACKPMPSSFPENMRMDFEVQACPVVRKASDGPKWNAGDELDAFLAEAWKPENEGVDLERESIYRGWLDDQLERRGGAKSLEIGMERFSIERMFRRTHGDDRKGRVIQRPDVTLTGRLEVTDSEAFAELLAGGLGRHKAFGYGMLKVKR